MSLYPPQASGEPFVGEPGMMSGDGTRRETDELAGYEAAVAAMELLSEGPEAWWNPKPGDGTAAVELKLRQAEAADELIARAAKLTQKELEAQRRFVPRDYKDPKTLNRDQRRALVRNQYFRDAYHAFFGPSSVGQEEDLAAMLKFDHWRPVDKRDDEWEARNDNYEIVWAKANQAMMRNPGLVTKLSRSDATPAQIRGAVHGSQAWTTAKMMSDARLRMAHVLAKDLGFSRDERAAIASIDELEEREKGGQAVRRAVTINTVLQEAVDEALKRDPEAWRRYLSLGAQKAMAAEAKDALRAARRAYFEGKATREPRVTKMPKALAAPKPTVAERTAVNTGRTAAQAYAEEWARDRERLKQLAERKTIAAATSYVEAARTKSLAPKAVAEAIREEGPIECDFPGCPKKPYRIGKRERAKARGEGPMPVTQCPVPRFWRSVGLRAPAARTLGTHLREAVGSWTAKQAALEYEAFIDAQDLCNHPDTDCEALGPISRFEIPDQSDFESEAPEPVLEFVDVQGSAPPGGRPKPTRKPPPKAGGKREARPALPTPAPKPNRKQRKAAARMGSEGSEESAPWAHCVPGAPDPRVQELRRRFEQDTAELLDQGQAAAAADREKFRVEAFERIRKLQDTAGDDPAAARALRIIRDFGTPAPAGPREPGEEKLSRDEMREEPEGPAQHVVPSYAGVDAHLRFDGPVRIGGPPAFPAAPREPPKAPVKAEPKPPAAATPVVPVVSPLPDTVGPQRVEKEVAVHTTKHVWVSEMLSALAVGSASVTLLCLMRMAFTAPSAWMGALRLTTACAAAGAVSAILGEGQSPMLDQARNNTATVAAASCVVAAVSGFAPSNLSLLRQLAAVALVLYVADLAHHETTNKKARTYAAFATLAGKIHRRYEQARGCELPTEPKPVLTAEQSAVAVNVATRFLKYVKPGPACAGQLSNATHDVSDRQKIGIEAAEEIVSGIWDRVEDTRRRIGWKLWWRETRDWMVWRVGPAVVALTAQAAIVSLVVLSYRVCGPDDPAAWCITYHARTIARGMFTRLTSIVLWAGGDFTRTAAREAIIRSRQALSGGYYLLWTSLGHSTPPIT